MTMILIVEDKEPIRDELMELLTLEGYDVMGAENGRIGVQMALQHPPDLILCDLLMPELDGYEVFAELQKHSYTASIPFIYLTAKTDAGGHKKEQAPNLSLYLYKPFSPNELLNAIQKQLGEIAFTSDNDT